VEGKTSFDSQSRLTITRRGLLGVGVGVGAASLLSFAPLGAFAAIGRMPERAVSFRNRHTQESLNTVYWSGDRYDAEALRRISHLMRDFRTGEVWPIDVRLIDILFVIQRRLDSFQPIEIVSGYRSPETNAMLAETGAGVARNSFHMSGMAVDIRMPGYGTAGIASIAQNLAVGGVGYYPRSDFVHLDVGSVRYWGAEPYAEPRSGRRRRETYSASRDDDAPSSKRGRWIRLRSETKAAKGGAKVATKGKTAGSGPKVVKVASVDPGPAGRKPMKLIRLKPR